MDGDKQLRAATQATTLEHHQEVTVKLCVWHHHCDLEKNLLKKIPGVDTFALKKELRAASRSQHLRGSGQSSAKRSG
jgi:hypothetical protein